MTTAKPASINSTIHPSQRLASLTERAADLEANLEDKHSTPESVAATIEAFKTLILQAAAITVPDPEHHDDAPSPELVHTTRMTLAAVHMRIADSLLKSHQPAHQREVTLAIDDQWIEHTLGRMGHQPSEYDVDDVMNQLEDLWDFEHLENKAAELIAYAFERTRDPDA